MKPLLDKVILYLGPLLASVIIKFVHARLKPVLVNAETLNEIWQDGRHVIIAFWHDQLLLMPAFYKGSAVKVLISASKDGELIARTMSFFSVGAVRGSSSRGGREALLEMKSLAKEPVDLGITPDGPKGPRHTVKPGVLQLARVTGRPIIPVAFACSHGHRFKSWDRFLLPYPWGKAVYHIGQPVLAEKHEAIEVFKERVQKALDENTCQAAEYLNKYDLSAV